MFRSTTIKATTLHTCPIHPNWVESSGIRNGPPHRKSDHERLRKIHWGVYRGCKMLADRSDKDGRDPSLFVSSFRIIRIQEKVISRSRRLRLITITKTLFILDITKAESNNNCFIIHWTKKSNVSLTASSTSLSVNLTLLLEIMHCARNLQIIH